MRKLLENLQEELLIFPRTPSSHTVYYSSSGILSNLNRINEGIKYFISERSLSECPLNSSRYAGDPFHPLNFFKLHQRRAWNQVVFISRHFINDWLPQFSTEEAFVF